MPIRGNERSAVIELISEINTYIYPIDIRIKRAGGESTLSGGNRALFPDIILFSDNARTQVLQGWEAKMPDVPITDTTLISNARTKAVLLGANSFVLWNFTSARLYVNNGTDFMIVKSWDSPQIRTREDVDIYEADWKNLLHNIILELNSFISNGVLRTAGIESLISENFGICILQRNKQIVANKLIEAGIENTIIDADIHSWWLASKTDFFHDEADPYIAYSKTILLHWLNRIVFAHLIKGYFLSAEEVDTIIDGVTPTQANAIFERITSSCDFFNLFASCKYDDIIPAEAWADLIQINNFLASNGCVFSQTSLQDILEHTVDANKRAINGQYTTPPVLAEILVKITMHNLHGEFFDPCCGTGTIVKAAKDYKKTRLSAIEAISSVWAEDKDSYPIQIAQLALSDIDGINVPVRLFKKSIFDLQINDSINIVNPADGNTINYPIPLFKSIASNLPFIAFENISNDEKTKIESIFAEVTRCSAPLDRRSDAYFSIIFALWKHLEVDGYLGVITSNSWLATMSGQQFYKALGYFYSIEQIHASGKGKWFANADVVTTILVLKKKQMISEPLADKETSFFLWHQSIEDLSDNEKKERLIISALQNSSVSEDIVSVRKYSQSDIDNLQAYNLSKCTLFHDVLWIHNIVNCLCKKSSIFKVFRGERRGWDRLFYPEEGNGIEQQYLKPVLKSSRSISKLKAFADGNAFCCDKTTGDLRTLGHVGALNWINIFQNEVNGTGKRLPDVLARANLLWYEMSDNNVADIITTMNPETRLFYAAFDEPTFINQRLIGLKFLNEVDHELCHALLNSMLEMFFTEACGFGRGLGVLDLNSTIIANSLMLNPNLLSHDHIVAIKRAFTPLKERNILPTLQELEMQDRIEFDHIVLISFGIDAEYENIKNSLLSMQNARLSVKE